MAWSRPLAHGDSEAPHAVIAPDGDVLVAATYREPMDVGGGPLPFNRSASKPHLLVARFSPDGALRWAHGVIPEEGTSRVRVGGLVIDTQGRPWLGGAISGATLSGTRLPDGPFIARLSPTGSVEAVKGFAGEGALTIQAVTSDAGGVVVVGDFSGEHDFGDAVRSPPDGERGAFVLRLDAQGRTRWSRVWSAGAEGFVTARAAGVDAFGGIYVGGAYAGAVCFGGGQFLTVRQRTPFVLKLTPEGTHAWSRDFRGSTGAVNALAVGPDRVYVAGAFSSRFYFQGQPHDAGNHHGFVAAFSADGQERWARSFAATATALATDDAGQLTVSGTHDGALELARTAAPAGLYVARLQPEKGDALWVRTLESPQQPSARTVAVDVTGHTLVAGALRRKLPPGTPYPQPQDGFLFRLKP
ncbi:hypothetical protein [Myxococcus sp. AS-1-15]|uniref:hypothetical protein n=1 Tax=Myxococcus sp. AS-1-15 TaxID=2874600 RepID=UPI001CBDA397|nr:hypothetical protein [Myxococcus sp. AS-1-15]